MCPEFYRSIGPGSQGVGKRMRLFRKFRQFAWKASLTGLDSGPHVTRYEMYRRLGLLGDRLPFRNGRVLSISHSEELINVLRLEPDEVVPANYPEHSLLSLDFPDASFDFVLSDQVLEHVEGSPYDAVSECQRVLRPGGIAIHTTCFINPVHLAPGDFWRFTPDALSLLHAGWSEIMEAGGWGNFRVWSVARHGLRFVGVPHAKWHPLHRIAVENDPRWPIVTWVAARK